MTLFSSGLKRLGMKCMAVLSILACAFSTACDSDGGSAGSASLAGTQWQLSAWSSSSQNPADFTITANFSGSDISGTSAVNLYGGSYSANRSGSFTVGSLFSTEMAGSEEAMTAEAHYINLLQQARKYEISGPVLTLRNESNQDLLIFQAR